MKPLSNLVSMLLVFCSILAIGQSFQPSQNSVTKDWKAEIEKLTTPVQYPLGGAKIDPSSIKMRDNQRKITREESKDGLKTLEEISKSKIYSDKAIAEFREKYSSPSRTKFSREIEPSATKAFGDKNETEKSKNYVKKEYFQTLKNTSSNWVETERQRRLESGAYSVARVSATEMGDYIGLEVTRPEMYRESKAYTSAFSDSNLQKKEVVLPTKESHQNDLLEQSRAMRKRTSSASGRREIQADRTGLQADYTLVKDSLALVAIYNALGGANWYNNNNWLVPGQPVNTWYGVSVNSKVVGGENVFYVTDLYLSNNNLTGTLPQQIGDLDSLRYLEMSNNDIIGAIPASIGNLKKLQYLYFGETLIDVVPPEIGGLSSLTELSLMCKRNDNFGNFVTDGIKVLPQQFWNLTKLNNLDLANNAIQSIQGIGALERLKWLSAWSTALTTLPSDIGGLDSVTYASFSGSQLASLPPEIGGMARLNDIDLSYNKLVSLPAEFATLPINYMNINGNPLTSLPSSISSLPNLLDLQLYDVAGADFSTPLNDILGMKSLISLYISIPVGGSLDGIGGSLNLESINISSTNITGGIPAEFGQLTNLYSCNITNNNFLNGSIAPEFFELPNLNYVYLNNNRLSGNFPNTNGSAGFIGIYLQNNKLDGFTAGIGKFPNLQNLNLSNNEFAGNLPTEISNNSLLAYLDLSGNKISGTIPTEWSGMSNLTYLMLNNNELDQPLPDIFTNLTSLSELNLGKNKIPGALPASIGSTESLFSLNLSENELTGLTDFSNSINLNYLDVRVNLLEFDDLEPIVALGITYDIAPQNVPPAQINYVQTGTSVTIDATLGGTSNHYTWYRNGEFLGADDSPTLSISNMTLQEAGTYWAEVSNDVVTPASGLYLSSGERKYWINQAISQSDSLALAEIYKSTEGNNWSNAENWMKAPVAMWEGVLISNGRVTALDLSGKGLYGGLPVAIGNLDALEWLNLSENGITYLPGELYTLSKLHYLNMSNMRLDKLSPSLGLLSSLDTLMIENNPITGAIPDQLFNLTNLKVLSLSDLLIGGTIPTTIGQLTKLEALGLSNLPGLRGEFPAEFLNVTGLQYLDISRTSISGGLKNLVGNSGILEFYMFDIPALQNEGIPAELGTAFTSIEAIGLGNADLSAKTISSFLSGLWSMSTLKSLELVSCKLPAIIDINQLTNLEYLDLSNNGITVIQPFNVSNLLYLDISDNDLDDISLFEGATLLSNLFAQGNKLEFAALAPFETYFSTHINYEDFNVSYMQPYSDDQYLQVTSGTILDLSIGTIDDAFDFGILVQWYQNGEPIVQGDILTYEILTLPEAINPDSDGEYYASLTHESLTSLTDLVKYSGTTYLQVFDPVVNADSIALVNIYNHFKGQPSQQFDSWMKGSVESWNGVIAIGGNVIGLELQNLSGTIPGDEIASLTNLQFLSMTNGNLIGNIPTQIFTPSLSHFDVGRNALTGNIPVEIANATSLEFVGLAGNKLSGNIPAQLGSLASLTELYLDNNVLTGAIPTSFVGKSWIGLSVDRNRLIDIPVGLANSLEFVNYVNFEYNNFDFEDLVNGSGNIVSNDYTYGVQGSTRRIYFTGDPVINGTVTLHAERQHPNDVFLWFRSYKYNGEPYFDYQHNSGNDSTYTFKIEHDEQISDYMAVIVNDQYKSGFYPFLTHQISVDPFAKRYVTAVTSAPQIDPLGDGNEPNSLIGMPNTPRPFYEWNLGVGRNYQEFENLNTWYQNPNDALLANVSLAFADNPIPINYLRIYSLDYDGVYIESMILKGTGGQTLEFPVGREIRNDQRQVGFPKTSFAVNAVDLVIKGGMIDAVEIGDTGVDALGAPVLSDQYTYAGPDYIQFNIQYGGLGQFAIIERSTDGQNFVSIDTVDYTGWYYDQVIAGKYFYRVKISYPAFGVISEYSNTLETGNCLPTFPSNMIWAGISEGAPGTRYAGIKAKRDTVEIYSSGEYGKYYISDISAGFYDQSYGYEYQTSGQFADRCGKITGFSNYGMDVTFEYKTDTLYVNWIDNDNNITAISKFYAIGDREIQIYPPQYLEARLMSSSQIGIIWDTYEGAIPEVVLQRAIGSATQYQDLATLSGTQYYIDNNTLDGQYYYYRVLSKSGEVLSAPSKEVFIKHKRPLFEPISNAITNDVKRESIGGAWGDFDADGDDDLYVSNGYETVSKNFLYENLGDGSFKKVIGTPATTNAAITFSAVWGDYDNDGFLDIYVPGMETGDILFRNTGSKSFERTNTQITSITSGQMTESATWVDINNDGNLDIVNASGFVFMNNGDGTFTHRETLSNRYGTLPELDASIEIWSVSHIDVDNDGDRDLYFSGGEFNMLYVNDQGSLTMVENGISAGTAGGFSAWGDFNNDGWVDLLGNNDQYGAPGIYVNHGNLQFEFVAISGSSNRETRTEGLQLEEKVGELFTLGDFNNDGNLDIISNIDGNARIALNYGNFYFELIQLEDQAFPISGSSDNPFITALADINNDGALDIYLSGFNPGYGNFVYQSYGNQNNWLTVKLKGIESNKAAIGAKVAVTSALGYTLTQEVVPENGLGSGNSLAAEFGLANTNVVTNVTVNWPSGMVTTIDNPGINQIINIVEVPEATGPTVNPGDSAILVKIYEEMNGASWTDSQGWLVGSPLTWTGTDWNDSGRLISLVLNNNNLTDTIPDEIAQLSALEVLNLSENAIQGGIPSTIGNMTALVNLSLNNNQLEGKIPPSIGSLVNLDNLDLYDNNLFGEIPKSIGNLTKLTQFEVHNNAFIGFVPAELGTLSNLQILRLDNNQFEGRLPAGLGEMSSLTVFYVNDNLLQGTLPADLGNITGLLELRIQNNEFEGEIPASYASFVDMEYADVSNNNFSGSIAPFAKMELMRYLDVSGNRFTVMPNMSANTANSILATNNWFDFGDFETNNNLISLGRLFVNPQDSLYERVDSLHNVGKQITIVFNIQGQLNNYVWKHNGSVLVGDNTNIFISGSELTINNPDTPNEGEYLLEVTNETYPEMKLITRPFNLKLTSLERDKKALLDFLAAVDNPENPNRYQPLNWSAANALTSDWEGITVTGDRVTALVLPAVIDADKTDGDDSKFFDGRVPLSFADLTGLVTLNLKDHSLRSFPNISKWPNIQTVDVSGNRLNFEALKPNVILGTKINYSSQKRIGLTSYDTLKAGDDPVLFVESQGLGATYQWKFGPYTPGKLYNNDVSTISDANSRVYQIDNLDYSKMGTYRVFVTHPDVPNLTIESRNKNIMAATDIFGVVEADSRGTLMTSGAVMTFRRTPAGPFVAEDTVQVNSSGEYVIEDVVLGDFIVLAKPDRNVYPETANPGESVVVDTYYEKADLYLDATTLEVRSKSEGVDIAMVNYQKPIPPTNGADFSGEVISNFKDEFEVDEEDDQSGGRVNTGRIEARKKVKRAACSMRRFVASGRVNQEGEYVLYAYVESDDEGKFSFENVEEGKYLLNIQYPGIPMDPDSDIEFIVGGDKENQLFTISAEITEDGITVKAEEILYSWKPYLKDINVYPNPTDGLVKVDFRVYRKVSDLKMEVIDSRGLKLEEKELTPKMGLQSVDLDMTKYESGIYFIIFTDDAGTFKHQMKITRL